MSTRFASCFFVNQHFIRKGEQKPTGGYKYPKLPRGKNTPTLDPDLLGPKHYCPPKDGLGPYHQKGVMGGAVFLRALSAFPLPTLPPPYLAGERMHVHVHVHVSILSAER